MFRVALSARLPCPDISGGKLESGGIRLAPPGKSAYSSCFNDNCIEIDFRPRTPAFAGHRGPFRGRHQRPSGPLRRVRRTESTGGQEAQQPARPHPSQSVLRGFDAHAVLVRDRGQAARRRRDEYVGRLLLDPQGRDPDGHGGDAQRHAPGYSGGAPPCLRGGGTAGPKGRWLRHQCGRRRARTSHGRRCSTR